LGEVKILEGGFSREEGSLLWKTTNKEAVGSSTSLKDYKSSPGRVVMAWNSWSPLGAEAI